MGEDCRGICRFIEENNAITLLCHTSPDGDTLGSALALMQAIEGLGKAAEVVCADTLPAVYAFLPRSGELKGPEKAAGYPAVLAVDCAGQGRLGEAKALFDRAERTANLDHHGTNTRYAQVNWVEERASCGELALDIIKGLGAQVSQEMAACLYTALMTDTGSFAYSNTTRATMEAAGELIGLGADCGGINRAVYHTEAAEKVRLHAFALERLALHAGGRIAIAYLTAEEIARYGAREEHCDGIVEALRDIETVEIAVFLRQKGGDIKASLRAKSMADVSRMAAHLEGGGHKRAAGYTHKDTDMQAALRRALELAEEELTVCC